MTELKPCPFCGSTWTQVRYICNPFDVNHVYGGFRGECTDCGAQTKAFTEPFTAADYWNRRVDDDAEKTIG